MTVSEYIFDFLSKKGVDTAFMVSGSSAMWLTDALTRETRYDIICNHHEQVCTMSADVYFRTRGKMAVCLVTVGPGATNAITGVAGAYLDSTPMFVLSGQASSGMMKIAHSSGVRQQGTQSLLLGDMVRPITKYFAEVMNEADIKFHLEKAWNAATTKRPGPVWLDVPVDIQNKKVPEDMLGYEIEEDVSGSDDIGKALELLSESERPLILAGNGVRLSGAEDVLLDFAERHNIPVVVTRMGIDIIPSDHPLFVGRPGAYGDRASHYAIQNADLILCIGTRLAVSSVGYDGRKWGEKAKKIRVDIDEIEIANDYVPTDVKYCMDVKSFLTSIMQSNVSVLNSPDWVMYCTNLRSKYPVALSEYANEEPLNSYYVVDEISKSAPENADIVVDTGTSCNVVSQTWRLKSGQKYVISGGLSSMGYWAGAVGASAYRKNRTIIALTGDGSFQMNAQELATIRHYNLPIKLFVFENGGYLLIRLNQHNYMNDRYLGVGPDSGVGMPVIAEVAKAYGLQAYDVYTETDLNRVLENIFEDDSPAVCVIHCKTFQEMAPRMSSKVMPDGSLKACGYEDLCPFLSDEEHQSNMEVHT